MRSTTSIRRARKVVLLVIFAIGLGTALRVWQYAANTSLWLDEIALARGIVDGDLMSLLSAPLPYDQVAPKGFLFIQKAAISAFGPSDYALRLFPFVCAFIALAAFSRLAVHMLRGAAPVAATVLFATASPLIAFGATVKQYSTDVCIAVLLWSLAYKLVSAEVTAKRAAWAALVGAILVWFSQPGVLMIAALGPSLVLFLQAAPAGVSRWRRLLVILAGWGIATLAVTVAGFASMGPDTREYMHRYWAAGFPPVPLSRVLDTFWPWDQLMLLFGGGPGAQASPAYPVPSLYATLTVVGLAVLWSQNRRAAVLLVAPLVVALGAAVVQQYPFSDRLILFLVPGFMLAIAGAIEAVCQACYRFSRSLGVVAAMALVLPALYPISVNPPPYRSEHVKAVLSHVQARWQPGDALYVYYGAAPAMTFYAAQYGFSRNDYVVGGCHRGDSRTYLRELDTFRGDPRVWVLITHAFPRYREREDILAYLDAIGIRRDKLSVDSFAAGRKPLPAEVFLYDLSDDSKLSAATADSFQVTGPASAYSRFQCGEGPLAMIASDFR
jgi:hypothetical protein